MCCAQFTQARGVGRRRRRCRDDHIRRGDGRFVVSRAPRGGNGVGERLGIKRAQPLVTICVDDEVLAKIRKPRVGPAAVVGPRVAALDLERRVARPGEVLERRRQGRREHDVAAREHVEGVGGQLTALHEHGHAHEPSRLLRQKAPAAQLDDDLCGNQNFTARSIVASSSTPSTRRLLDGVAMPVHHRSTTPARPRHRREMT